jgi:MFS family permease
MFFFGAFIGSFILPRLADLYGRRPVYLFGLCLYACTALCHPFSRSLYFSFVLIFLGGISESGRYYVGFVYLQELMPPSKWQTYSGLMIFIVHAIAKICYELYFYKISKNWLGIAGLSITLVTFAITSVIKVMPESPRYLYSKGRVEEARASFRKMGVIN